MDAGIVDADFKMDPETEELIPNGTMLKEGMEIISYHRDLLVDIRSINSEKHEEEFVELLVNNRWCTIEKLKIEGDEVKFVAIYADGPRILRQVHIGYPWIAKKSFATPPKSDSVKYEAVLAKVLDAMLWQKDSHSGCSTPYANKIAEQILEIFGI